MKKEVFKEYVDKVTDHFDMTSEQLFAKKKDKPIVDARHVLFYLCHQRQITSSYIKHYMSEYGYDIALSSIGHGIKKMDKEVGNDPDYATLIDKLK